MQSSPSACEDCHSAKASLDHLQLLIEHLLRENRHLKCSLQQTRSHLDEVRAHLNRFKLQVAENERNDRLMAKQIQSMTALIERHRDVKSPPPSPEVRPTPPSSSACKLPSSPTRTLHACPSTPNISELPSVSQTAPPCDAPSLPDVNGNRSGTASANDSDNVPCTDSPELASVSQTAPPCDAPSLPDVNGNRSETPSANDSDTVPCTDSPVVWTENIRQAESSRPPNARVVLSSSRSPPAEHSTDKLSSPSTSVSDALQKAFVAMEKDTTNTVQVLHDTKHMVARPNAGGDERRVETVPHLSPVKNASREANIPDANRIRGDGPQHKLKKRAGSSQPRSLKALKRKVAGRSPASDTDLSASRSLMKDANGRLKRSLTQNQSSKSPSQSANHLARSVALKKTKKGYKVSLALSRNSSKSGDSSSGSSDEDSDSSGPGCSASISRPLRRPAKAQVSLQAGLPDLISTARRLKDNLGHRKEVHGNPDDDSDDSESQEKDSERNSNHAGLKNNGERGIENGSFAPVTAIACSAADHFEDGHESFPRATGSPHLGGRFGEEKGDMQGAVMMNQNRANERTMWQHLGQSNPFMYENTSNVGNLQHTPGTLRNPVTALENHPLTEALVSQGRTPDSDHRPLAAGKATDHDLIETSTRSENPTIHDITHVPVRPRGFALDDKHNTGTSRSTANQPPGDMTEFLTNHSRSSEMLPWKARPGSKYVDVSKDALAVKHRAAVSLEDGKVVMNGKMRVAKPVSRTSNSTNYYYVSPTYPDGTFLPYVPVSGVVLHGKPVHWDSSRYADQSVQLSFSKEVFDTLVLYARRAYRKRHPGAQINIPGAFLAGHRVRKVVRIEPECSVNMTRLHRTPSKCSVADTLADTKKDVVGLVLLYLSIEARSEDRLSVEVIFTLHSMVAHRLSAGRRR